MRPVLSGIKLATKRWRPTIVTALLVSFACIVISLFMGDVATQRDVMVGAKKLRELNATVFSPNYPPGEASRPTKEAKASLAKLVMSGSGYTSVVNNVRLDEPDFARGLPVIVIFGSAASLVMPNLRLCAPAPCISRGSRTLKEDAEGIKFGARKLTASNVLPNGATWFDPRSSGTSLDRHLILNLPNEDIALLDSTEAEEALANAVTWSQSPQETTSLINESKKGGLLLVPQNLASTQSRRFDELIFRSMVYIMALAAFLGLVLIAYAGMFKATFDKERASFLIRKSHGATNVQLATSVATFLFVALIALPAVSMSGLFLLGEPFTAMAKIGFSLLAVALAAVIAVSFRQIQRMLN